MMAANYDWFKEFDGSLIDNRGEAYERTKAAFGKSMIQILRDLYPQVINAR
jgi:hypothetical protein